MLTKHREALLWLLPISSFLIICTGLSEGTSGGADSYVHFRIARWAFKHPELFFDHWGKPLFTMTMATFAQLGFTAVKVTNTILACISAWFAYDTARKLNIKASGLVIPLLLLSGMYPFIANSSLTEIIFSLVAVFGVNRIAYKQYIAAAIIISFVPFARTEGFIFIVLFALYFALNKQWKAIPFLFTGAIAMSIAGAGVHDDIFWIWTRNPYTGARDIYGAGSLNHFFNAGHVIFGNLGQLFVYIGSAVAIGFVLLKKKHQKINALILAMAWGYFTAHSFVWWRGMGGSLGLIRVICGVTPLMAILGAYTLQWVPSKIYNKAKWLIIPVLAIIMGMQSNKRYPFVYPVDDETALVEEASAWIESENTTLPFIAYYNPLFTHFLNLDFMDRTESRERIGNYEHPGADLPPGALILWDSHFGPAEGGLPQESLDNSSLIELIRTFEPEEGSYLGEHQIRIYRVY